MIDSPKTVGANSRRISARFAACGGQHVVAARSKVTMFSATPTFAHALRTPGDYPDGSRPYASSFTSDTRLTIWNRYWGRNNPAKLLATPPDAIATCHAVDASVACCTKSDSRIVSHAPPHRTKTVSDCLQVNEDRLIRAAMCTSHKCDVRCVAIRHYRLSRSRQSAGRGGSP